MFVVGRVPPIILPPEWPEPGSPPHPTTAPPEFPSEPEIPELPPEVRAAFSCLQSRDLAIWVRITNHGNGALCGQTSSGGGANCQPNEKR